MNLIATNYYYHSDDLKLIKITEVELMFYEDINEAYELYTPENIENYTLLNWVIKEDKND